MNILILVFCYIYKYIYLFDISSISKSYKIINFKIFFIIFFLFDMEIYQILLLLDNIL